MSQIKSQVCGWVEQGHITQEQANTLYRQVTVLPDASSWRGLIANLLLWFGALSFASGLIFSLPTIGNPSGVLPNLV
ncbi:hypothetical protein LFREDSHE_19880 [Shewanella baltica]